MRATLEAESAECGLACLAMIASAHGYHADLAELRRRFPISLKGATLVLKVVLKGPVLKGLLLKQC